jgi:hypothetical protein
LVSFATQLLISCSISKWTVNKRPSASKATPIRQQNIAGLVDGGTYTFYVWARVVSGTKNVSIAIVNNAYSAYLAFPTQVTRTTTWQRFRITDTVRGY